MTVNVFNMTDTWNDGGTVFAGLKLDVTNTASAAGSKAFDFQIGSNSVFDFDVTAGILSQRNSTNAQTFRVYNTFTDASNYERGVFDWTTTANTLTIGTQKSGTGSNRDITFVASSGRINLGTTATSITFDPSGTAGGQIVFGSGGQANSLDVAQRFAISAGNSAIMIPSTWLLSWANTGPGMTAGSTIDTSLARGAAGIIQFASAGSFTANSTTATVLGSLGPAGAHTTVQRWLTIIDNSGNTLYIPCF